MFNIIYCYYISIFDIVIFSWCKTQKYVYAPTGNKNDFFFSNYSDISFGITAFWLCNIWLSNNLNPRSLFDSRWDIASRTEIIWKPIQSHCIRKYWEVPCWNVEIRSQLDGPFFPSFPWIRRGIWGVRVTLCVSLWASKYTHYMIIKAICPSQRLSQTLLTSSLLLTHIKFYCNFCKRSKLLYFGGISIRASVTFSRTWTKWDFLWHKQFSSGNESSFISLTFSVMPEAIRASFAFRAQRKAPFRVTTGMEMGFTTGNGEMNSRVRGMGSLRHTLNIRAEQDNGRATSD